MFGRKKKYIVHLIPDHIWRALSLNEQGLFFRVEDCMQGRFTTEEMRRRLDEDDRLARARDDRLTRAREWFT